MNSHAPRRFCRLIAAFLVPWYTAACYHWQAASLAPAHAVVTEEPTYPGIIDAIHRVGARPVGTCSAAARFFTRGCPAASAPISSAFARRPAAISETTIARAPAKRAHNWVTSPIGPAPKTAAYAPG